MFRVIFHNAAPAEFGLTAAGNVLIVFLREKALNPNPIPPIPPSVLDISNERRKEGRKEGWKEERENEYTLGEWRLISQWTCQMAGWVEGEAEGVTSA